MAYGAQFYDSSGNLIIDIDDRLYRLHSTYSFSGLAVGSPITVTLADMTTDGSWVGYSPDSANATVTVGTGSYTISYPSSFASGSPTGTVYIFRV